MECGWVRCPSSLEIVFILLTEVDAIYIQVLIIKIKEPSFEELFARTRLVILFQQLDGDYISFQELLT